MTMPVSVTHRDDQVVVELQDASHPSVAVELSRHEAFALMAEIGRAVNALPFDPTVPLNQQKAVLKATHPSFQVGLSTNGDVTLAIQIRPYPPLEFEFEPHGLNKLIADLRKAANIPSRDVRTKN